ncbi:hypothetical protein ACN47E_003441 [Coniothyrium glycines]
MTMTSSQTGAIIAGCAGAIFGFVCVAIIVVRRRYSFISEDIEKFGELYVPSNRKPTTIAFEIITQIAAAVGQPGRVKNDASSDSYSAATTMETGSVPRLTVNLSRLTTMIPMAQAEEILTEHEASKKALDTHQMLNNSLQAVAAQLKRDRENGERSQHDTAVQNASERIKADEETFASKYSSEDEMLEDRKFVVGDDDDDDDLEGSHHTNMEVAVDPMSYAWGSGKAVAAMYC